MTTQQGVFKPSITLWVLAAMMGLGFWLMPTTQADATPIYAIRAANACDTCHIEPIGWANPEEGRLCTLSCNGCHVSSTGGGLRTPTGLFYGKETIPTWGERPSTFADPLKTSSSSTTRPANATVADTKGRFRLLEGFSGWFAGSVPMKEIDQRFGNINANPTWSVGADVRAAVFGPLESGGDRDFAAFPMQADLYLMHRAAEKVVLYASGGLKGSRQDRGDVDISDYFTVREAFAKIDNLPYNSQVRAGRFVPAFGWRLPDHTSFIRRDLGFDQNRQVFGIDASVNPNYAVVQGGVFYQGLDAWPGDTGDEGFGASMIAGWRDLGWQLMGNFHTLQRPDEGFDEVTVGMSWGLNLYPLVYLGELDARRQSGKTGADSVDAFFAYHELNWLILKGVTGLLKYDWADPNLNFKDDQRHRATLGIQWAPWTYHSLDVQYRANFAGDFTGDTLDTQDFLAIYHFWY